MPGSARARRASPRRRRWAPGAAVRTATSPASATMARARAEMMPHAGDLRGLERRERCADGKSCVSPAIGVSIASPKLLDEPRGDACGRGDRDLLAEDRAHRDLEAVEGAGHAQAGTRVGERAQRLRDLVGMRTRDRTAASRATSTGGSALGERRARPRRAARCCAATARPRSSPRAPCRRRCDAHRAAIAAASRPPRRPRSRAARGMRASRPSRRAGDSASSNVEARRVGARRRARVAAQLARASCGSACGRASLKRRRLAKPLAIATSMTGSAVSVSRRLASSRRCVCAYSTGATPNSCWKTRRRCRSVTPRRAGERREARVARAAVLDQCPRRPARGARVRIDARVAGRELRPAAQARAEALRLRPPRRSGRSGSSRACGVRARAHRAAVDARRAHAHEEAAVEARVVGRERAVALVGIE